MKVLMLNGSPKAQGNTARALKEIGYKGYFTLEADRYLAAYTADTLLEGARKMVEAARRMADVYERA